MMANTPPYHTPIYFENLSLGQVAEVTKDPSGKSYLDTDYKKPTDHSQQQWNLDPSDMSKHEYFVKLQSDDTHVLESPEEECGRAFMNLQGNRYDNGGIQVWVLEQLQIGPNMWALRNFKTQLYLYLDYDGGGQPQPKVPIIVRKASVHDQNAQWKITLV